jgi:signal transduction histidine kinase
MDAITTSEFSTDASARPAEGLEVPEGNPGRTDLEEVARVIHDHRSSIRTLGATLDHVKRCLAGPLNPRTEASRFASVLELVFAAAQDLQGSLHSVLAQSEERIGEPGAAQLSKRLTATSGELSFLVETLGAENVFRLRDVSRSIQSLLTDVRREQRTPISRQLIKKLVSAAREVESQVCLYDIVRVEDIVQATLEELSAVYSRLSGVPNEADPIESIDALAVIAEALNRWDHIAKQHGIELRLRGKAAPVYVTAPRRELYRAISNLLDNGIKYTGKLPPDSPHERPWIVVATKTDGKWLSIIIESWGVPFTKEEIQGKLFFNYGFRGHYARQQPNAGGSGQGLTEVQRIAKDLGGEVEIWSEPVPKGQRMSYRTTEVVLRLPQVLDGRGL